jgi:membrane protein DedA with SNARE-associated domain
VAGASGLSHRRFVGLTALSAAAWASYSILVGLVAGSWVRDNPLLGAAGAVVVAVLVGIMLDRVSNRVGKRSARRARRLAKLRADQRAKNRRFVRADSATRTSS